MQTTTIENSDKLVIHIVMYLIYKFELKKHSVIIDVIYIDQILNFAIFSFFIQNMLRRTENVYV